MALNIKTERNAAGGAATLPGEIKQFKAGVALPAGFEQIAGPAERYAGMELYAQVGFQALSGAYSATDAYAVSTDDGRLFMTSPQATGHAVVELDANLAKKGGSVAVASLGSGYRHYMAPLADGNLICFRGTTVTYAGNATVRINTASMTQTVLASKPTALDCRYVVAAQAANGVVYGLFAYNSAVVDAYDYASNTWAENIATAPRASAPINIVPTANGNLLFVWSTEQYLFNTATKTFTLVGSLTGVVAALQVGGLVRLYTNTATLNGITGRMAYADYYEPEGGLRPPVVLSVQGTSVLRASRMPGDQGGTLLNTSAGGVAHIHYIGYTPHGTVTAVKL